MQPWSRARSLFWKTHGKRDPFSGRSFLTNDMKAAETPESLSLLCTRFAACTPSRNCCRNEARRGLYMMTVKVCVIAPDLSRRTRSGAQETRHGFLLTLEWHAPGQQRNSRSFGKMAIREARSPFGSRSDSTQSHGFFGSSPQPCEEKN